MRGLKVDDHSVTKVLEKTLCRGGEYADIFLEQKRVTSIHLEDQKIEKVVSGVDIGVGVRLISAGKTSYAFSNDCTEASLLELAEILSKTSQEVRKDGTIDMKKRYPALDFHIAVVPDSVPMDRKIGLVKTADRTSRSYDSRIRQVSALYRDSVQQVMISSSDGFIAREERIHNVFVVQVIASDGDVIQTGYESAGGHIGFELFDQVSAEAVALKAAKRAVMMLTARRAQGGRMPVVISSEAGGTMIHEAIGHGLEADLAQQGLSVYSRKLGEQVASSLVTVIDDATIPFKRGSYRFDDEGIPSSRVVLVDRGILKGYLYDRLAAMKDNVAPTGNGRRESYRHRPIPRMTNTFIAPGDADPDEVIRSTPSGLLVRKMGGGQVNTVTGDFVFEVQEGYTIENGSIGELVRDATLTGNGPEVLKSIDMVASDLGFSIGTCGKDAQGVPVSDAMPTIRISQMVVGGEV